MNTKLNFFSKKKILIYGLGKSGVSAFQFLKKKNDVSLFDDSNLKLNNSNIKKLYLIRDRVGQKPLYYKKTKNSISFSSNLKSLLTIEKTISLDNDQIINYLN